MKHSDSLKNIAPAILRAQRKIKAAIKDANNPFFKSKYADLESCWEAVKEPLHSENIAVIQTMGFIPGAGPTLITTLLHESGEYVTGEQPVCAKAENPQDMGSAITYARRYGLSAAVSLIQVDDDGNAGSGKKPEGQSHLKAVDSEPGSYMIKVGTHANKRLDSIDQSELSKWAAYHRQNKNLNGPMLEAVNEAEKYLEFVLSPAK